VEINLRKPHPTEYSYRTTNTILHPEQYYPFEASGQGGGGEGRGCLEGSEEQRSHLSAFLTREASSHPLGFGSVGGFSFFLAPAFP
jgi:hypothetical protein